MTKDHHKAVISANINQYAASSLLDTLAATLEELDAAKAKIADLEAKLSPKPEPDSKTG